MGHNLLIIRFVSTLNARNASSIHNKCECLLNISIDETEIFLLHNQAGNSRRLIGVLTKAEQKKPPKAK